MTAPELEAPTDPRGPRPVMGAVRRHPTLAAALVCLVSFAAFWVVQRMAHVSMVDLMVYRAEGWTARNGEDLYDMVATSAHLPNTYPPFAALLFIPLTFFGVGTMRTLATAGNLVLLVAVVHLSLRLVGRPRRLPRPAATLALSALLVWCEPVWTTLRYGQINLLLAVMVLWDLTRRDSNRWAGIGIGIAAGIKLTPALFAVFLALAGAVHAGRMLRSGAGRRAAWNPWLRQAAVATGTFCVTALLSAIALPRDSHRFWTEIVFAADRVGEVEITANQSLRGALARLLHTDTPDAAWLVLAALTAAAGLSLATGSLLRGQRSWATLTCAATALLVSPISWSHHWVWGVPMLVLLGSEALEHTGAAARRWWAVTVAMGLMFCSFALWWVPHAWHQHAELHQNGGQMLLSAVYPLAGLTLLVLTAVRLRRLTRNDARSGTDGAGNTGEDGGSAGGGNGPRQAAVAGDI
ncbi:polyprenol-phosphate-mannose-dependent alpha-(1-2)-phosphatidylinositol pentamannoside mannosyltransferase [Streptomyces albospinus]|uniref:Polyprenol-phosphate-mannose-dependent alpha-(1-2)-phosphatidylinositol pentamannoside mannosyltransferase n=1 Tax=Streptomyces albospinus TaxID=285515 RepID=A0ABQ2UX56_9ACTN|nr:glycosyltransferase 87 family protein [Streptomyces albospinus]GGU58419.1 polyprenol-phosphate-mannose-dependent alpha-(1-2)-phosphatidylinositol pentamannoside mannosyltransferase [Streptomyces albospinus]